MSSWAEIGWRVGNLVAGAGALYLADAYGWRAAYLCMAAAMAPGLIAALLAPEPESDKTASHDHPGFIETVSAPIQDVDRAPRPDGRSDPRLGGRVPHARRTSRAPWRCRSSRACTTRTPTSPRSRNCSGSGSRSGARFSPRYVVPRIGMMASLLVGTVFGSASHLSLAYLAATGATAGALLDVRGRRSASTTSPMPSPPSS